MLISLPYLRAGLHHYTPPTPFRISSPFIISILSNIMTLSIVLFLRALLFFALATSLAAGPVPQAAGPARPIAKEKDYLIRYPGVPWVRAINSLEVSIFLLFF
jgi:hypothetical protein